VDFGTIYDTGEEQKIPGEALNYQLLVVKDSKNRLHIFNATFPSPDQFEEIGIIDLKSKVQFKARFKYTILDAQIISTFKLLVIIKIEIFEFTDKTLPAPSEEQLINLRPYSTSYEI